MKEPYFVLVAGSGTSSRANTEALMEDHYYANGSEGTFVLAFDKSPTRSQTVAAQYAQEQKKDIVIFCHPGGMTAGLPAGTLVESATPIVEAIEFLKGKKATAMLLWADEDSHCSLALHEATAVGIPCFDLSNGLLPLTEVSGAEAPIEPKIPQQEQLPIDTESEVVTEAVEDDFEGDEEEYEEEEIESDLEDELYEAVWPFASVLAEAFAQALVEQLKDIFVVKGSE